VVTLPQKTNGQYNISFQRKEFVREQSLSRDDLHKQVECQQFRDGDLAVSFLWCVGDGNFKFHSSRIG
jgi:hypothetical protein